MIDDDAYHTNDKAIVIKLNQLVYVVLTRSLRVQYVRINLNGLITRTDVQYKELHPEWDQTFAFANEQMDVETGAPYYLLEKKTLAVELTVWDEVRHNFWWEWKVGIKIVGRVSVRRCVRVKYEVYVCICISKSMLKCTPLSTNTGAYIYRMLIRRL